MTISPCDPFPRRNGEGFSTSLTRRTFLIGTAVVLTSVAWDADAAVSTSTLESDLLKVSKAVTGKADLDATTADRIGRALAGDDVNFVDNIGLLASLAETSKDPQDFLTAADATLKPVLMRLVTAWYTGTVQTNAGPVVVAYRDALMYRPVSDGLTVPTYCNKGPLWWTGLPPQLTVMPTNNPKVL